MLTKQTLSSLLTCWEQSSPSPRASQRLASCETGHLRSELIGKGAALTHGGINHHRGRRKTTEGPVPPLLAVPSRYSTAWSRRSTPSITAADPSLLAANRDRFLSSSVSPASTATYVRPLSSNLALRDDSHRCLPVFECTLVTSLKG